MSNHSLAHKRAFGAAAEFGETTAPRILIVEDDSDYALRLLNSLKDWRMPLSTGECKIDIAQSIERAKDYLNKDAVDIFIVDLIMREKEDSETESDVFGKNFVREIATKSNAGIIIVTSLAERSEGFTLLTEGADDYIQKYPEPDKIRARILALWRRIQLIRPNRSNIFAHTNRVFRIGDWRFVVGSRALTNSIGETVRLSPTEHAFLRYICTVEGHECDRISFNLHVLGRRHFERKLRIDNFIYRIRNKLGESIQFLSDNGAYKLIDVREIKPSTI